MAAAIKLLVGRATRERSTRPTPVTPPPPRPNGPSRALLDWGDESQLVMRSGGDTRALLGGAGDGGNEGDDGQLIMRSGGRCQGAAGLGRREPAHHIRAH